GGRLVLAIIHLPSSITAATTPVCPTVGSAAPACGGSLLNPYPTVGFLVVFAFLSLYTSCTLLPFVVVPSSEGCFPFQSWFMYAHVNSVHCPLSPKATNGVHL